MIECIHESKGKTSILVEYDGVKKNLVACDECMEVIGVSNLCKILEVKS